MEWSRAVLKDRAKFSVRTFYWKSVLVAFILALVNMDFGGRSGGGRSTSAEDAKMFGNNIGKGILEAVGGRLAGPLIWSFLGLALVTAAIMAVLALVLSIFVFQPLAVGCKKYFLEASDGNAQLDCMGYAFRSNYMNVVSGIFLMNLFIFLWSLLLIVPGIIKAYQYRMIPYLLAEDSGLSFSEAKRLSTEMMDGEKWDAFVLDLSFILWEILSAATLGLVGVFWVNPYYEYTCVELYKVLRRKVPGPYYTGNDEW